MAEYKEIHGTKLGNYRTTLRKVQSELCERHVDLEKTRLDVVKMSALHLEKTL